MHSFLGSYWSMLFYFFKKKKKHELKERIPNKREIKDDSCAAGLKSNQ